MLMALERPQFIHFVAERNSEMHPLKLSNAVPCFCRAETFSGQLDLQTKKTTVNKNSSKQLMERTNKAAQKPHRDNKKQRANVPVWHSSSISFRSQSQRLISSRG